MHLISLNTYPWRVTQSHVIAKVLTSHLIHVNRLDFQGEKSHKCSYLANYVSYLMHVAKILTVKRHSTFYLSGKVSSYCIYMQFVGNTSEMHGMAKLEVATNTLVWKQGHLIPEFWLPNDPISMYVLSVLLTLSSKYLISQKWCFFEIWNWYIKNLHISGAI
jgi:hypothetical protein